LDLGGGELAIRLGMKSQKKLAPKGKNHLTWCSERGVQGLCEGAWKSWIERCGEFQQNCWEIQHLTKSLKTNNKFPNWTELIRVVSGKLLRIPTLLRPC
jgi:hypothetical protein